MTDLLGFDTIEFPWLNDPAIADPTWSRSGEGSLGWLARSTLPRAHAARQFLRYNIAQLPAHWQRKLCCDLRDRWPSAFFELIVARTLQALGAEIQVELRTQVGKRPDFRARFADASVVVEATTPEFMQEEAEHLRWTDTLKNIIEEHAPNDWSIAVHSLPDIGPQDSKKEFKHALARLFDVPPATPGTERREVSWETSQGVIRVTLIPERLGHRAIVAGPAFASYSDAIPRIRRTLRYKRDQIRASHAPVILAINAGFGATLSDFDRALFGSPHRILDHDLKFVADTFEADGAFARRGVNEPTYAGALVYLEAGFTCPAEPCLYSHPRATRPLPSALEVLTQRGLVDRQVIEAVPAQNARVLGALRPVDLSGEFTMADEASGVASVEG